MYRLSADRSLESVAMRDAYCQALIQAAEENPGVVAVEADVMSSMGTAGFARRFPARSINCGIQEANAIGVSAGLSLHGFIPFFHTFAVFASRRVFDQVFLSCGYAHANVKIIGGDAGVTASMNGGTHMPFEDVGLMRCVPGMTILEPADSTAMKALVPQMARTEGNFYMRFGRKSAIRIYEEGSVLTVGKASVLREGSDVSLLAAGIMVAEALRAADLLQAQGVGARVVDMFTIKPVDRDCIVECAMRTGAVVTAENHNHINGLGSAVAEVLSETVPVPLERVGVQDEYGEVGEQSYLMTRFGLTAEIIVEKALKAIRRKRTGTPDASVNDISEGKD